MRIFVVHVVAVSFGVEIGDGSSVGFCVEGCLVVGGRGDVPDIIFDQRNQLVMEMGQFGRFDFDVFFDSYGARGTGGVVDGVFCLGGWKLHGVLFL